MMENKNNNSAENEDFLESVSIQSEERGNISKKGNFYETLVVSFLFFQGNIIGGFYARYKYILYIFFSF